MRRIITIAIVLAAVLAMSALAAKAGTDYFYHG